jgi:hypothetical protein
MAKFHYIRQLISTKSRMTEDTTPTLPPHCAVHFELCRKLHFYLQFHYFWRNFITSRQNFFIFFMSFHYSLEKFRFIKKKTSFYISNYSCCAFHFSLKKLDYTGIFLNFSFSAKLRYFRPQFTQIFT